MSQPSPLGPQDHLAASGGAGCLETQLDMGPAGGGCTQARRQRPLNREIQVSKEPSGSLATGAEVGQCQQWAVVRAATHRLLAILHPHSLGLGAHPGLPPLLTGEVSIPVSQEGKLRPWEVTWRGYTSSKKCSWVEPRSVYSASHLTAGPFPGAWPRAWHTAHVLGASANLMTEAEELVDTYYEAPWRPQGRRCCPHPRGLWASEAFLLQSSFACCPSWCQIPGKGAMRRRKPREGWEFPGGGGTAP